MLSILKNIYHRWGCCLHCGSLQAEEARLCEACLRALSGLTSCARRQQGLFVASLYRWAPGESDILSRLITSLKGGGGLRCWNHFSAKLIADNIENLPSEKKIYVVPAPGNGKDHAYLWGKALANRLGADFRPCLKKKTSRNQRGAGRAERTLIEMELLEKNTGLSSDLTEALWIFADDILTTGSTARAAHLALGRPTHFQVWVLAERSLSCGASSNLL